MKKSELKQMIREMLEDGSNEIPSDLVGAHQDSQDKESAEDIALNKLEKSTQHENIMKKNELKQMIREVLEEVEIEETTLTEAKKGLSGNTVASKKTPNTKMKSDSKSITSTDKPKEKKEGTKLPVKEKKKNTETKRVVKKSDTPKIPVGEKKEGTKRPVGGTAPKKKSLKEALQFLVKEAVDEYRTKGALGAGNANRTTAVKNTGLNYKGKASVPADAFSDASSDTAPEVVDDVYAFEFIDPSGNVIELDPDLPYYGPNQLQSYLEKEVMAFTGKIDAKLSPDVLKILNMIKVTPEKVQGLKRFILRFDPGSKEIKITGSKT